MAALVQQGQLGDIGFVEFTVGLINGVIDALVAANTKQIMSFIDLLQESAQTLASYTANHITEEETALVGTATIGPTTSLTPDQVKALANVVPSITTVTPNQKLLDGTGNPDIDPTDGAFKTDPNPLAPGNFLAKDSTSLQTALTAALTANASGQYQALQQMVKMGFSRVILDNGIIETRLTFNAYTQSSNVSTSSSTRSTQFGAAAAVKTKGKLARFVDLSASASYSRLSVNMASQAHRDVTGSSVQIFGRVELHLKSDYMPLSK